MKIVLGVACVKWLRTTALDHFPHFLPFTVPSNNFGEISKLINSLNLRLKLKQNIHLISKKKKKKMEKSYLMREWSLLNISNPPLDSLLWAS